MGRLVIIRVVFRSRFLSFEGVGFWGGKGDGRVRFVGWPEEEMCAVEKKPRAKSDCRYLTLLLPHYLTMPRQARGFVDNPVSGDSTYATVQHSSTPSMLRAADLLCPPIWVWICDQGPWCCVCLFAFRMVDRMFFDLWLSSEREFWPTPIPPGSFPPQAQPQLVAVNGQGSICSQSCLVCSCVRQSST
jgi:hypothetical protein